MERTEAIMETLDLAYEKGRIYGLWTETGEELQSWWDSGGDRWRTLRLCMAHRHWLRSGPLSWFNGGNDRRAMFGDHLYLNWMLGHLRTRGFDRWLSATRRRQQCKELYKGTGPMALSVFHDPTHQHTGLSESSSPPWHGSTKTLLVQTWPFSHIKPRVRRTSTSVLERNPFHHLTMPSDSDTKLLESRPLKMLYGGLHHPSQWCQSSLYSRVAWRSSVWYT